MAAHNQVPTVIRGVRYYSQKRASIALNVSTSTIWHATVRGTLDTAGLGKVGRPGKEITLYGVTFPNACAASKLLGYEKSHVRQVMKSGKAVARENLRRRVLAYAKKHNIEVTE